MVSTEANNTDWQAATRAFGDLPADARAAALGAVAWMQPTTPRPTGFAQAAVAYLHDAPTVTAASSSPLTLASSHPAAESAVSARDIAQILNEVSAICTTAGVPVHELTMLLDKIKSSVGVKSLDAIRNDALNEAQALVVTAGAKAGELAETAEAQRERLWGEIGKLNEEITTDLEELHKRGLVSDEEYEKLKKERKRLDALDVNDPARIKGEEAYNNRVQKVARHADEAAQAVGDSDGQKAAERTKTHAEQQEEKLGNLNAIRSRSERASQPLDISKLPPLHNVILASAEASNQSLPMSPDHNSNLLG